MPGRTAGLLAIGGLDKPEVPSYNPINPQAQQRDAIEGNIRNQAGAAQFANLNLEQLQSMLGSMMPGYGAMNNQMSEIINSQLRGEIPQDVQDRLQSNAAAKAIGGGYGGTGMHGDLVARDFGKTSYEITQQGLSNAERWQALSAQVLSPVTSSYLGMFVTPAQQTEYAFRNEENRWQRDWLANQVDAMPSPMQQAIMMDVQEQIRDIENFFMDMYGGGGGMGGGMGGMGG